MNIEKYVIKGQYKWPCERKYNGIGERAREKRIIHAVSTNCIENKIKYIHIHNMCYAGGGLMKLLHSNDVLQVHNRHCYNNNSVTNHKNFWYKSNVTCIK